MKELLHIDKPDKVVTDEDIPHVVLQRASSNINRNKFLLSELYYQTKVHKTKLTLLGEENRIQTIVNTCLSQSIFEMHKVN